MLDMEDRLIELVSRGVDGFESIVLAHLLTDFMPEIFFSNQFGHVGESKSKVMLSGISDSSQLWLGSPSRTNTTSSPCDSPRDGIEKGLPPTLTSVRATPARSIMRMGCHPYWREERPLWID